MPRPRIRTYCFIGLIVLFQSTTAHAASRSQDPRFTLDIASKPLPDALIDLAYVTGISIAGADPKSCRTEPRAIRGRYTSEQALRLLLKDSRCELRRFNATTFALKARPEVSRPKAAPPAQDQLPQETTVTVVRRPLPLSQSPSTISLISPLSLMGNDQDLARLAARVPGMTLTNLGPGRDKILLRGLSDSVLTGRTQSTVGLYLDDTPLTYNAPNPDLPMVDLAQVEVLKGPQGALYGQGSLSGVVRLVSRKPDPSAYAVTIDLAAGHTEGGRPSSNAIAMLNVPLMRDHLALRMVAYNDKLGGYIDDRINGRRVSNSTNRYGGRLSLRWQPDTDTTLTLSGLGQNLASANSQYVMGKNRPYRRPLSLAEPHNNRINNLSATLEKDIGAGVLKITLNRLQHRLLTGYNAQPLSQYVTIPNSGILYYEEEQRIRLQTQEISLMSDTDNRLNWFVGAFAAASSEEFSPTLIDAYTRRVVYDEHRWDRLHDLAVFGRLGYDLTPRWNLTVGVRSVYSHHEIDSRINNVRLTNYLMAGDIEGRIEDHRLTYSLGLRYQPRSGSVFYAQFGDGYRGGGYNTTTFTTTAIPTIYQGDHLDSYEFGWRRTLANGRLSFNLVGFHARWKNIQSDQLRSTGLPITVNLGTGINNGIELEADWRPLSGLIVHAAAKLNDPRLVRPSALFIRDKDMGLPYMAKQSLSLSANWRKPLGHRLFDSGATLAYRGESPLNFGSLRSVRMEAYAHLDLFTALSTGNMRYKLRLDNATGVRSNSFAYGNPFTIISSAQITPVRPRTLWLALGYQY